MEPGSQAADAGIVAGDRLVAIAGQKVRDFLDLHLWLGDEELHLTLEHKDVYGKPFDVTIQREYGRSLGLTFPDPRIRLCGNDCPFCFVDQLPDGVRKNLDVRDDDYRFSYLYGNFITLTNLKEWEFERIIEQELSPLYISVHAIDPVVREKCLKSPRSGEVMDRIHQLLDGGIDLHTQIVAIPGINDGFAMEETIFGLADYYPGIRSVAVVPVGLTGHRAGLPDLRTYTRKEAGKIVEGVRRYGRALKRRLGAQFVYIADEFVVLAGKPIPGQEYYDGFEQTENGVGMVRQLWDRIEAASAEDYKADRKRAWIVTGESFGPLLKEKLEDIQKRTPGTHVEMLVAENQLFGRPTTVAGLLGAKDILRTAKPHVQAGDIVLIPDEALNQDGVFLDDWTMPQLEKEMGVPIFNSWDPLLPPVPEVHEVGAW
ncbi:MAG: DUF512 domain-containing protein [Candidatus Eisenbacteria bacterium]|uniref:DUF512 domain-containing protein n=1 Tax=Eiseniibacteriota bacterium TaxID=2212470 RepID=A0A7Y2E649_UNCEI|nr:DUF512 domain-containing protein [Candidatus Eisenbacteria bacterium]